MAVEQIKTVLYFSQFVVNNPAALLVALNVPKEPDKDYQGVVPIELNRVSKAASVHTEAGRRPRLRDPKSYEVAIPGRMIMAKDMCRATLTAITAPQTSHI